MASQTEFERGALWGMNHIQRMISRRITELDPDDVVVPKEKKEG